MANQYSITDDLILPQVIILPKGEDENSVVFDILTDHMETEANEMVGILVSVMQETDGVPPGGEKEGAPGITDLASINRLIARRNNLVVAFCKKGGYVVWINMS